VFLHANATVLWESRLQQNVAAFTSEAELIAGSRAVEEALYVRKLWHNMFSTWIAMDNQMDNQSTLVLIKNPAAGAQKCSTHIDVCYNFSRHHVICGISVSSVRTQGMIAGVFTKQLPGPALRRMHRNLHELSCIFMNAVECSLEGSVAMGLCSCLQWDCVHVCINACIL
jgi:hypothetical protein